MNRLWLVWGLSVLLPASAQEIRQVFPKDHALWVTNGVEQITRIVQSGKIARYTPAMLEHGVHFRPGRPVDLRATIVGEGWHNGGLLGVHGQGSHVRFRGHWDGDEGGGFPMLVLTAGGKMSWETEAEVDFVMAENLFTRQLWAWGDGSGVLELAPGFVADRTEDGRLPNAMGTIRLNGVALHTHASASLPYNTRPDGRGGLYHNGHVVFEGEGKSRWIVDSQHQSYAAQIDFGASATLEVRSALTHHGQLRDCLPVGNGGPFVSTGAFRTTKANVTITKSGPGMLSLDGQQGYQPGARLRVEAGYLRMQTDPGDGARLGAGYGSHLHVEVLPGARCLFAAPRVRLAGLTVHEGATVWTLPDTELLVDGKPFPLQQP